MTNRKASRIIFGYVLFFYQSFIFSAENSDDYIEKQPISTINQFSEVEKLLRIEPVRRGSIYSRDGVVLAESKLFNEIVVLPQRVFCPTITNKKSCSNKLSKDIRSILSIPKKEFEYARTKLSSGKYKILLIQTSKIKNKLIQLKALAKQYGGVYITTRYQRRYYYPRHFSHVVGYIKNIQTIKSKNKEFNFYLSKLTQKQVGITGLERYYDETLTGETRHSNKPDSETPFIGTPDKPKNIYISIDLRMQKRAYQLIKKQQGSMVAFDPNNGEVLTLLSLPGFNSNHQANKDDPRVRFKSRQFKKHSLFPRFKAGKYPPGSTIKPVYALAGLHHDLIKPTEHLRCKGVFKLKGLDRPWHDWETHGKVDFWSAIAKSCNVYFFGLSQKLKIDRITDILETFNIGSLTGIDLPNERSGIRPSREYKKQLAPKKNPANKAPWYRGDSLAVGIGQGYLTVTPLQLATMVSMLSKQGKSFIPRLLLSTEQTDSKQRRNTKPILKERIHEIKLGHWHSVVAAMTDVVHRYKVGTAFKSAKYVTGIYKVAGKTGTAQVVSLAEEKEAKEKGEKLPWNKRDHSLFIGFAPAKNPQIAVAVIIEHGGHGSDAAAPAAVQLINYYLMSISKKRPERRLKKKTKKISRLKN